MRSRRRPKKAKKLRVKHPVLYSCAVFVGLLTYAGLVWYLYKSKQVPAVVEVPDEWHDPLTLVARTQIQTLIPDPEEAVIFAPDISHVTEHDVVVFVQSDYSHTERRQLIRHTWGQRRCHGDGVDVDGGRRTFVVFAVGTRKEAGDDVDVSSLDLEMSEHGDILLLSVVDVYESLTVKGLLAMTWLHDNLPRDVRYVIKTDDDVFLNVYGWLRAVEALAARNASCLVAGFVWTNPSVIRTGKYAVGEAVYRPELYPSFCSGAAYAMSRDAVAAILEAASRVPLLLRDDVYFTGILARTMAVSLLSFPVNTIKFTNELAVSDLYAEPVMAVHGLAARQ